MDKIVKLLILLIVGIIVAGILGGWGIMLATGVLYHAGVVPATLGFVDAAIVSLLISGTIKGASTEVNS